MIKETDEGSYAEILEKWFNEKVVSIINNQAGWSQQFKNWIFDISSKRYEYDRWNVGDKIVDLDILQIITIVENEPSRFRTIIVDEDSELRGCKIYLDVGVSVCCWQLFNIPYSLRLIVEVNESCNW